MLLPSPRIFGPLLSSLLVLALLLLLIFLRQLVPRLFLLILVLLPLITSCSLYDDPFLYPVTDDGSDSEGVVFPSIDNGDFSAIP